MPDLLHEWVSLQAERRPDAVAVVGGCQRRITYAELEARSNQLARVLRGSGCRRGDRVALLMPKSPEAIIGLLGIYKADAVYVPLDPSNPASRLARILGSADPAWLLAAGPVAPLIGELEEHGLPASTGIGWMDSSSPGGHGARARFAPDDLAGACSAPLAGRNTRHDPAHILFTSGSTGAPKGVVITHASVIRFVEWAVAYFGMESSDRVSGHPPLNFDLSIFDVFGAFAAGAELHLIPPEANLAPHRLAEMIRQRALTQWFSVPSALTYMAKFDVVRFDDFPALRRVLWCGEVLPTTSLVHWMERLRHVRFTNLYGPTETTIASSYYTVPACPADSRAPIPIGTACDGEELLVLDESLRPVPPGEAGDLWIGGAGLSPGYWRDAEKTAAAFVTRPGCGDASARIYRTGDLARVGDDGLVYFLGRADSQIKSRGYRIELGEIEAALTTIPALREAAVTAVASDGFEGTTICAAYVAAPGAAVTPAALRSQLSKLLPPYMLPTRWKAFEGFPRNANGKTDRRRLKEAFEADGAITDRPA